MREVNASILGNGPFHEDLFLGLDGQIWRMTERGQETVASGGAQALVYAEKHGFPEAAVLLLRARAFPERIRS